MTTKLKTLKDMNDHIVSKSGAYHIKGVVLKVELKQEAIKWIKHYQQYLDDSKDKFTGEQLMVNHLGLQHTVSFIKDFFNISDKEVEELHNESKNKFS